MSEIVILRLFTGEEILADVDFNYSATEVMVNHPTRIQVGPNPQTGNIDVHMAPLLTLAEKKSVPMRKDSIAFSYAPVVEIRNKFNKLFGSGLILPTEQGIIKA